MKPPAIKVEIIHIEGPLKGTIQEFVEPVIEIGRHPECHVCFPKDMNTISRKHAEIRREGNRFMAIDHSTNGTLVNGKMIQELILKDGDVLTISENGPKISILTTIIKENELPSELVQPQTPSRPVPETPTQKHYPDEHVELPPPVSAFSEKPTPLPKDKQEIPPKVPVQNLQQSFVIQFGPKIKSFQTLPITLGVGPECDFTIDHPEILSQHAQIYYSGDSYHIKDLSGRGLITINSKSVSDEAPLIADTCVSMSNTGPTFQFLGEGRLAEIETSPHSGSTRDRLGSQRNKDAGKAEKKTSFWSFKKK